jgi:predicted porin
MNKNIKLAVAGAVLALSASANAGIIIPAGDWTLDINGNVNGFMSSTHADKPKGQLNATGGIDGHALAYGGQATGDNKRKQLGLTTGLLPAWIGFTGKTRQNDLDVEFTISLQPQISDNGITGDGAVPASSTSQFLNRQTYLSFGDKSWGSIKIGKDLGIFASDAILNDMTLLGVGSGGSASGSGDNTTLGRIGTGYLYAAWKGQVAYTTPNMNGFQATVGITNPNQIGGNDLAGNRANQDRYGYEGKASYSFATNDVTGKVWASGATYDVTTGGTTPSTSATETVNAATTDVLQNSYTARVLDVGATVSAGGFTATGYYYDGKGVGTTFLGWLGTDATGKRRDSDGGYVQLTYVLPTKTKVGLSYGESNLDRASGEVNATLVKKNESVTVGAYHPLTKHLNLVAEYTNTEARAHNGYKNESDTYSLGAILFF